ncbi:MAG: DUF3703 domain-containing protein [Acidimicrobiales bacterium]
MTAPSLARRAAYRTERAAARQAFSAGDTATGWRHLERAHVLAQPNAIAHVGSHLAMLRRASTDRDTREVAGQVLRAALAGPASLAGRIPTGNDGRARTPLSKRMPIPPDLEPLLRAAP